MIKLSIQDKIDGNNKIDQLRAAVGTSYLGVTKLISVSKDGNTCVVEENGKRKTQPSWLTWNRFFY